MGGRDTIRKTLTAMLALAILLWAEAGLALLPGDQVMQCSVTMHGHERAMAEAAEASDDDSDAMPCCPADPGKAPKLTASHPQCCSSSDVPERPLGFVVSSGRITSHQLDTVAEVAASDGPPTAQHSGGLRSPDAPRFVKPVLDLKSDLRI
jgi:hypothetical protein